MTTNAERIIIVLAALASSNVACTQQGTSSRAAEPARVVTTQDECTAPQEGFSCRKADYSEVLIGDLATDEKKVCTCYSTSGAGAAASAGSGAFAVGEYSCRSGKPGKALNAVFFDAHVMSYYLKAHSGDSPATVAEMTLRDASSALKTDLEVAAIANSDRLKLLKQEYNEVIEALNQATSDNDYDLAPFPSADDLVLDEDGFAKLLNALANALAQAEEDSKISIDRYASVFGFPRKIVWFNFGYRDLKEVRQLFDTVVTDSLRLTSGQTATICVSMVDLFAARAEQTDQTSEPSAAAAAAQSDETTEEVTQETAEAAPADERDADADSEAEADGEKTVPEDIQKQREDFKKARRDPNGPPIRIPGLLGKVPNDA